MRNRLGTGIAAALLAAALPAQASDCLRYEPEIVSIDGVLSLKVFPGPPHYASLESGDAPEAVWILTPTRPICIDAIPDDSWNIARSNVQSIQVVQRSSFSMAWNGKLVQIDGSMFRARGGHPHAEIVLRATRVAPNP